MTEERPPERILLVEGVDDKHVARHLRLQNPDMPGFCISEKEGFSNLRSAISPEVKVSDRTALGILVDADDDPNARWDQIVHQLQKADVEQPSRMDPDGTIVENRPRIGIWLMPDNESPGELEDFIEQLIPPRDLVWPLAQRYIDGIPEADRKFKTAKIKRARIHAWLAALADPLQMGTAIRTGDLNAKAPLAMKFTEWLRRLFG